MSAGVSGGSCQVVPILSAGSVSEGRAVDVRAGSWEGVIVFSEDGDSTWGNAGSAGRAAGL